MKKALILFCLFASCFILAQRAFGAFILYDTITGETRYSDRVDTAGFVFNPSNLRDQSVISESRRAIQFLFDPKNQPGLSGIMGKILTEL